MTSPFCVQATTEHDSVDLQYVRELLQKHQQVVARQQQEAYARRQEAVFEEFKKLIYDNAAKGISTTYISDKKYAFLTEDNKRGLEFEKMPFGWYVLPPREEK